MAEGHKPTESMREAAKRGLELRKRWRRGGTQVGVARARDIVNNATLSPSTIKRMHSFFSRHANNYEKHYNEKKADGGPSPFKVAWLLWAGNPGRSFAASKSKEYRALEGERPYASEHAASIADPDQFDDFRRENDAGGAGIDFIFGIADGESEVQSIRFDADIYSVDEAREWLDQHDFTPIEIEEAAMEERHIVSVEENEETVTVTFAKEHESYEGAGEELRFSRDDLVCRAVSMENPGIDRDARRVTVGVSSEQPVKRSFGLEVIDHSADSMDLTFLRSGRAPLLLDHDMSKQIGIVEDVELDEASRRLRAIVRFGKSSLASEVFDDVVDGIRRNISVGYELHGRVERKDDPDEYYRVKTRPLEVSIVSIPADGSESVGVGRSHPPVTSTSKQERTKNMESHVDVEAAKAEAVRAARENDKAILDLAARFNRRDLGEAAIGRGLAVESFRGELLTDIEKRQALEVAPLSHDVKPKEQRRYSLGALVRAQITGNYNEASFEREMHQEIVRRTGKQSEGFFVPDFAWRAGPMSAAATGAVGNENVTDNFVPQIQRGDLFIEALRSRQVMSALGVTYMGGLTNRIRIPKFSAGANAGFVEELGDVTDQSQTDAGVLLQPRTLGAFVEMSRLLMMESIPAIEQIVRNDLLASVADRIEYYAINGTGGSGQPTGLLNAGIGNVDISAGTDVDALTWADIVALVKTVEESNGVINAAALGWLSHPAVKAKLASTAKVGSTDSVMLLNDPWNNLYGYNAQFTANVPTNLDPGDGGSDASALIYGDWSQLMVGLFNSPSILVNPYAGDKAGTVRVTIHQEVDVAVRHNESFAKTDEVSVA
jgi:HK97 family phage major capsid protein/HK97 family phage prohead protease